MLSGERLILREWREHDLAALAALRNDAELQARLMAQARPNSVSRVRQWLADRTSADDGLLFVVASRDDDTPMGYVQVTGLDRANGTGELGICLSNAAQGKGHARECCILLEGYLRNTFSLRKLTLRVLADNTRAIRFYIKAGYREVGRLERHFLAAGRYHDVVLMERFIDP